MTKPFRFGLQSFNADVRRRLGESGTERPKASDIPHCISRTTYSVQDLRSRRPTIRFRTWPRFRRWPTRPAVTSTINIGCRVFCIDYHNPVVLAKSAMTIDMLSNGRLELGLGAGLAAGRICRYWYRLR